jgi:predicted regulator of Ras-like GTPase activity (Roadblock/LC7/MglB family)
MEQGTLRQATIHGSRAVFVLAPTGPGLLAVATAPSARLGLVNLQIETARNMLAGI